MPRWSVRCAAGPILEQSLVDVAQRELSDSPHALGRELQVVALLREVAGLVEQHHDLAQVLKVLHRLLSEQFFQVLHRDGLEVARHQVLLELLEPLHLAHQLDRLLEAEALGAVEKMAVAIAKIFEIADVLVLFQPRIKIGLGLGVFEVVALELAERFAQPARHPRDLPLLFLDARLLALELVQGLAFAAQEVLKPLLHLGQRALEVEFAVALAHLLANLFEELLQAHHLHAVEIQPLAHHPFHRLADVVGVGKILGQLLEHLVGVEPELLGTVPLAVAADYHRGPGYA